MKGIDSQIPQLATIVRAGVAARERIAAGQAIPGDAGRVQEGRRAEKRLRKAGIDIAMARAGDLARARRTERTAS